MSGVQRGIVLLVVMLAAACATQLPPLPEIGIDGCELPASDDAPCSLDFGARDLSVSVERILVVTNPSEAILTLTNIELVGDPSFRLGALPASVAAGTSHPIVVTARPKTETIIQSTLSIASDAVNVDVVTVGLTVVGVDNGIPDIEVTPTSCDFSVVVGGESGSCDVTIVNRGNRNVTLDSVAFVAVDDGSTLFAVPAGSERDNSAFSFDGCGGELAPLQPAQVCRVLFTPDVAGAYRGKLRILSNDPDEELVEVLLVGSAT